MTKGRPSVRRPDLDTVFSVNPDGSRNAIHPADVRGRFQRRKALLWTVLIVFYLALPWVEIGGHPALLIDLARRHFYLLGSTFNAQDFWLAFFFVSGLGFALFVVAGLFGRLWCGYACPHTVFLEGVFRRIERWIEGSAPARARLDQAPMRAGKLLRRGAKMAVFLAISVVITHSLLGYFMPVRDVVSAMTESPAQHPAAFLFALIATGLVFVNFTWFREQTCIVVCPYGRLQGALYDPDTVNVGYDEKRGEPRGAAGTVGAGDCVDCFRCVSVCPTGIDIRNGTQMECVGCANCIDACDEVMTKLGRPRGLVRYDSQRAFESGRRQFVRPRLWLYVVLLAAGIAAFAVATGRHAPFEANLLRNPGPAFTIEGERVHNTFRLHVCNKLPMARTFELAAVPADGVEVVVAAAKLDLGSLEDATVAVHVFAAKAGFRAGLAVAIDVRTEAADGTALVQRASAPLTGPVAR